MPKLGTVQVDTEARVAHTARGPFRLTRREVELLEYLHERGGEVVPRHELERRVWGHRAGVRSEAVPVAIRRLRRKIEPDPASPTALVTVPGQGWRLSLPVAERPKRLPRYTTPWWVRPTVFAAIDELFAARWRVVTLVGPAGAGKTRAAVQYAEERLLGAVHVPLGGVASAAELVTAVGDALHTGAPGLEAIAAALDDPRRALVLDEAELAVEIVREVLGALLEAAPRSPILVTSRRPLGLDGEALVEVGPLAPDDAVGFLTGRLRAARAPLPDPDVIRRAAAAFDGLPLGLEIAVGQAHQGLDAWLDGLEAMASPRGIDRLHDALRRSWDVLQAEERRLLQLLTLFEAPLLSAEIATLPGATRQAFETLADRSLLCHEADGWRLLRATRIVVAATAAPWDTLREEAAAWLGAQADAQGAAYRADPRIADRTEVMLPDLTRAVASRPPLCVQVAVALADILWERNPRALAELIARASTHAPHHPVLAQHDAMLKGGERGIARLRACEPPDDPVWQAQTISVRVHVRMATPDRDVEALLGRLAPGTAAHFSLRHDRIMNHVIARTPTAVELGELAQLVEELRASPWIPETAMAWADLAHLQLRHGTYHLALRTADEAAGFCEAHHLRSTGVWARYLGARALGRLDLRRGAARMAGVAREADRIGQRTAAGEAWVYQGYCRLGFRDLEGAERCFVRGTAMPSPVTSHVSLLGLAGVRHAQGHADEAVRTLGLVQPAALRMPRADGSYDRDAALLCVELERALAAPDPPAVAGLWARLEPHLAGAGGWVAAWAQGLDGARTRLASGPSP